MAILVALYAMVLILAYAPLDLGSVRAGGVSVLWWYAFVVAPALGALITAGLLLRGRP